VWPIINDFVRNSILLFGLGFIYAATNYRRSPKNLFKNIVLGFVLGGIAVLVMRLPWKLSEGVFFDTRNILFTAIGLFFGLTATLISALIGIIYRISLGGAGVYAGVSTIVISSILGLSWFKIRQLLPNMISWIEYYVLGIISCILTILCFLFIPDPLSIISQIIIPMLVIFPFVMMILAKTITNQKERLESEVMNQEQKLLLQASIDSTKTMEIFALDKNMNYISFNQYHAYVMNKYFGISIKSDHQIFKHIKNDQMQQRMKSCIFRALSGESCFNSVELEIAEGRFVEEHYSPIRNKTGDIYGVAVFIQDVSDRKQYEQSILYLSYKDPLTNLNNRRYYTEEMIRLDDPKFYPFTLISGDINGLKLMNDAFGHDAGDLLLCTVADEFIKVFKDESRISRVGGDEFIILLPNTDKTQAESLIEKFKTNIEKYQIYGTKISISFGFSTKTIDQPNINMLKTAEDDMYTRKLFEFSSHRNETIKTIIHTLHEKNPREEQHSNRVSQICRSIGELLGMKKDELNLLEAISNLHDIGKIAIDEAILNKPGRLDPSEWEIIKRHPEIGYRILSSSSEYSEIAEDILCHHERYDGKGYPRGIQAEDIPLRARIISIADAYDAMVSERPYRKPMTHEEAVSEILINKGTQFDPKLVDSFMRLFAKGLNH
jgi:diguanylate cyclase (GGDEF)-like protein